MMRSGSRSLLLPMLMLAALGCGQNTTGTKITDGGTDGGDAAVATCDPGTWDNDVNPSTPCVAWSDCPAGTSVVSGGTSTTDRSCATCAPGSFSNYANASGCTAYSDCPSGTYVSAAGTASSDRVCAACASGTFSTTSNATSCAAWTDCIAGEYVMAAGSASADRTCNACAVGSYSTAPNSAVCAAVGTCAAGTYETAPATSTSAAQCTACDVGTFCAGGSAAPMACATGTWDDDANPASACVPWTQCSPGFSVGSAGSATADRTCTSCASGTFSSTTNAASCTTFTTCQAGEYVSTVGSAIDDQMCSTCASGTFSTNTNAASCTAWTDCQAGQYVSTQGSAIGDQTCTACASGTFSTGTNAAACMPVGSCMAGYVQTAPGTETTPVACQACTSGTFCAGGTAPVVPCGTGDWDHDGDPASACIAWTDCAAGSHVLTDGTATADRTCTACGTGTFSTTSNAPTCTAWTDCVPGQSVTSPGSADSDRVCAACAPGKFSATTNALTCMAWTSCVPGEYIAMAGTAAADQVCMACAANQFSTTIDSAACTPIGTCAAGTVETSPATSTSDVVCDACVAGTFCAGGTAPSVPCATGTWDHDNNPASACVAWSDCSIVTKYVSVDGTATSDRVCAACAAGTFSATANAASCTTPRNCKELLALDPGASDGVYTIDVDGAGSMSPFSVYCDMTTQGGGWTLVLDSNAIGPDSLVQAVPGTDTVTFGSALYLPLAHLQALANLSSQVMLESAGDASHSFTTVPDSEPIQRLQQGVSISGGPNGYVAGDFTGPYADDFHLWWDCGGDEPWPNVYHACDNQTGLHLTGGASTWSYASGAFVDEDLALFVR